MPPRAPLPPSRVGKKPPETRKVGGATKRKGTKRSGKRKQKKRKLELNGWLKTPADWARFDAWAKINALPRKNVEPEPIERVIKPLSYFKERLVVLAAPTKTSKPERFCRSGFSVSKRALRARASKRVEELAIFARRNTDCGKETPNPISKAALRYKPSRRIVEISRPKIYEEEECKTLEVSRKALKHETTPRENEISLPKIVEECPNSLTDEEREELMTLDGVMKSALTYKITDWIQGLALPSYRFLRERGDQEAKRMMKELEEIEDRRRKVVREQRQKEEKESQKKRNEAKERNRSGQEEEDTTEERNDEDQGDGDGNTDQERERKNLQWRKEPGPCKDRPLEVSKAALNATASARIEEIAKPHIHKSDSCRKNPYVVKRSALSGNASARIEEIAKPVDPLDPVERPPPREKNEYGVPIFPKPKYGKVMPKVKPYKMRDCKTKEEMEKPKRKRHRQYRPVPLYPSIDPCLDPEGAKRQAKARKAAKEAQAEKTGEQVANTADE